MILMLSGCIRPENVVQIQNETHADDKKVEDIILNDERLVSAVAVFHDDELISGVTVKTFSRFHKEKIEKEIKKDLEKVYPELEITVSADNKIIKETTKLLDEEDQEKLDKKLKKIKSLLEEET